MGSAVTKGRQNGGTKSGAFEEESKTGQIIGISWEKVMRLLRVDL